MNDKHHKWRTPFITKHLKWTSLMKISLMTTYIYVKFTIVLSLIATTDQLCWRPLMASINTNTHTHTHRQSFFSSLMLTSNPTKSRCSAIAGHTSHPIVLFWVVWWSLIPILMEASVMKSSSACASHSPQFKFSTGQTWTYFIIFIR